jgi:hypothetical protein
MDLMASTISWVILASCTDSKPLPPAFLPNCSIEPGATFFRYHSDMGATVLPGLLMGGHYDSHIIFFGDATDQVQV